MTCIKTGCDVAFGSNPFDVGRADAHYYRGMLVFRARPFEYDENPSIDFLIQTNDVLVFEEMGDQTIIVSICDVTLNNPKVFNMIQQYHPEIAAEIVKGY